MHEFGKAQRLAQRLQLDLDLERNAHAETSAILELAQQKQRDWESEPLVMRMKQQLVRAVDEANSLRAALAEAEGRLELILDEEGHATDAHKLRWALKEERVSRVALQNELADVQGAEHRRKLELRSERQRYNELRQLIIVPTDHDHL